MKRMVLLLMLAGTAVVRPTLAGQSSSPQYRLFAPSPTSAAASTQSPAYQTALVGGNGIPIGIAASDNASVIVGPGSGGQPGDFLFEDDFE